MKHTHIVIDHAGVKQYIGQQETGGLTYDRNKARIFELDVAEKIKVELSNPPEVYIEIVEV